MFFIDFQLEVCAVQIFKRQRKIGEFVKRVVIEELVGVGWKFTRYIGYKICEYPTEPSILVVLTAAGTKVMLGDE